MVIDNFRGDGANDSDKRLFWRHSNSQGLPPSFPFLLCFHWFPDVEMAIVLYIDDAISTDTLNMSRALE